MFLSNPFTQAVATVGQPYASTLATNAVSPFGDALTFAKAGGASWLNVAGDGALSGVPALADIGPNLFTVSLADANGWSSTAAMSITVASPPSISISAQGTNIVLNWRGGQPPYQVQRANGLLHPAWQNLGAPTTNTSLLLTATNSAAFYRVQGQ
jgi:hypothetical protein